MQCMVNLTPEALSILLRKSRDEQAVAAARFNLTGSLLAEEERDEWAEAVQCLEQAVLIMPKAGCGKRHRITDAALLEAYQKHGNLRGTMKALDYYDHHWISKRLRAMGAVTETGRRRKGAA